MKCNKSFVINPSLSLTKETNKLKLVFNNENHEIFDEMANYIEVVSIEGYPQSTYTYIILEKYFNILLIAFNFTEDILNNVRNLFNLFYF